ncbi:FadR/GntR family transcriptional regulator [Humibacter soli]
MTASGAGAATGTTAEGASGAGRPRRSEQLAADLLDLIRSGVVRPGAKLPTESELGDRFGVSRTVVREAIAQLGAAGVVRSQQGRGTFVLALPNETPITVGASQVDDLAGLLQLFELRTAVEVEAAGLAARRRTADQLGALRTALAAMTDAARDAAAYDPAAHVAADFAFHVAVARATANQHFVALLDAWGVGMLAVPGERLSHDDERVRRLQHEHAAVLDAIAEGDAVAAQAAMRTHLVASRRRLAG